MIHRYWIGPATPGERWTRAAIRSLHRGVELHDWTDESLPADVVGWLDQKAEEVGARDFARHRANLVRWWAVATYGGIWLDNDVLPLIDLRTLSTPWIASLRGSVSACAMGMPQGDRIAASRLETLRAVRARSDLPSHRVSGDSTLGPMDGVQRIRMPFDAHGRFIGDSASPAFLHLWTSTRSLHHPPPSRRS